ncbi:hypothetical protein [Cryobacterium arcticum]|uniref:(2Fe-2S) ferredoxin domain-containing protein n=1 Tax=Cryobacterium arcticum TaxID=670052 RepID=A0A1B1BFK5_9MICO|nr:hypothetical protein [Cryobacterium arcticum]ANP71338.1 hypothetical protein PA27867_0364 [Cryobacterium arcticum]
MTSHHAEPPPPTGASGPLIALCAGHRCEALHRLADDRTGADRVRSTVANRRGAVLVSTPCVGACVTGAVAAVACRDGATGTTGASVWLGGVDQPAILHALLAWIRSGGPASTDRPVSDVPAALQDAVLGVGRPIHARSQGR